MTERAYQFGARLNLLGILNEPPDGARIGTPIVLLLNAGLLHRVGPHRLSVELARRLARQGIASLRLDVGGRGDSEASSADGTAEANVIADIRAAMDFLEQQTGCGQFVLLGLCAGADGAHAAALEDPRVAGVVLLDGYGYRTLGYYLRHYAPRALRPRAWLNYLRRLVRRPRGEALEMGAHGQRQPFGARLAVAHEMQTLVDRGVELLYVYTGGAADYYNYSGQFERMFHTLAGHGRIAVEFYPTADHTYTFSEDRERLLARVLDWCGTRRWQAS